MLCGSFAVMSVNGSVAHAQYGLEVKYGNELRAVSANMKRLVLLENGQAMDRHIEQRWNEHIRAHAQSKVDDIVIHGVQPAFREEGKWSGFLFQGTYQNNLNLSPGENMNHRHNQANRIARSVIKQAMVTWSPEHVVHYDYERQLMVVKVPMEQAIGVEYEQNRHRPSEFYATPATHLTFVWGFTNNYLLTAYPSA